VAVQFFLGFSVLIWLPYGVYCFIDPSMLAGAGGVEATTPTGTTEIRAMYGGLQAAIGLLAAAGLAHASLRRPALVALTFLTFGLALARLVGASLDDSFSTYTVGALIFEIFSAGISSWLWATSTDSPVRA